MKISYIGMFRSEPKPVVQLCGESYIDNLSLGLMRWYGGSRESHKELLALYSQEFTQNIKPGEKYIFDSNEEKMKDYKFYVRAGANDVVGVLVADAEYPEIFAHHALGNILEEFLATHKDSGFSEPPAPPGAEEDPYSFPQLKDYIAKYQNPDDVDSIANISKQLDETKKILHSTIESVLGRGEKIDQLVDKSQNLSEQSQQFYKKAKKQNSCCVVM